jgi:hypothetical protein
MKPCLPMLSAALAAGAILAAGADARADSKQECAAAYDKVQSSRDQGKLLEARRQAVTCSAPTCSVYVTKDCSQWLAELDASLPTVVFTVRDPAGADASAVRITVDGTVIAEKLDGKAVPMDPGEHVVRFEMAGAAPLEQKVLIRQGERNRTLVAAFKAGSSPDPAPAGGPTPGAGVGPVAEQGGGGRSAQRTVGIALLAVGGAGIVVGAVTGALVIAQHGTLATACGKGPCPSTEQGDVNAYHTKGLVSTIGFIGGAVVAGAGVVVLLTAPKKAPAIGGSVTPYLGLGTVGATGRFW